MDHHSDQVIFSHGDAADSIFYIRQGKVKLTVVSKQGKEAIVGILSAGAFFGEECLAGQNKRRTTSTAMSWCFVAQLEKAVALRVLHEQPAFSKLFLQHLLARNIGLEEDLVDQLFNSSEKRLARVLLRLANLGKAEPAIGNFSQQTLAGMVGITRSRVSFLMNKFRKLGLIDHKGHLEIHSSLRNVILRN
jgi:CRP/FNR family cyclic AMP-dependent transcriptional regulator